MKVNFKKIISYILFISLCLPIFAPYMTYANESEQEIVYDIDENGNISERVVEMNDAITEEEAMQEYFSQFIGGGDIAPLTEEATQISITYDVIKISADGTETVVGNYANLEEATVKYNEFLNAEPTVNFAVKYQNEYAIIKYGVVLFKQLKTDNGASKTTSFKEDGTNVSGYLSPSYGIDAVYLETKDDKVKFKMAGVTAWVNAAYVDVVPYADKTTYVTYYKVENGKLYHRIRTKNVTADGSYSSSIVQGKAPAELSAGVTYYSYDGHYFYTDYFKMIDDYRTNSNTNALNKDKPYYNYYQYLSHRTKTVFTEQQLNDFLKNSDILKGNTTSKMLNTGLNFLNNQTLYGSNALLTMGVAANESNWGRSNYAMNRNNLFGHAAYDSNPDMATGYNSVNESIKYHTQIYVSKNYASPTIWEGATCVLGSNYFSANLGDKSSGMNIKYASDPYWGEKNASFSWLVNDKYNYIDYGRYTIGMKNTADVINIRKEPNTTSKVLYQTERIKNVPFVILGTVDGETVNGSNKWYKIQSDAPLKEDRSSYTLTDKKYRYDYVNSYAYIHSSYVDVIFQGNATIDYSKDPIPEETPEVEVKPTYNINKFLADAKVEVKDGYVLGVSAETSIAAYINEVKKADSTVKVEIDKNGYEGKNGCIATDMILKITSSSNEEFKYTFVVNGDINSDGKISSMDYVLVKNHILKINNITGSSKKAADVNKDDKISSMDYVLIKNHILKISEIK